MCKRAAIILILMLAALGLALFILNVIDIDEDYRIRWPSNILDTILISATGIIIALFAVSNYSKTGSRQTLLLGCGMLAFGVGTLARNWLTDYGIDVSITIYEGASIFASALHLGGAIMSLSNRLPPEAESKGKLATSVFSYLSVLAIMAILTLLVFLNGIPPFDIAGNGCNLPRNIANGVTILFFLASSIIYLILYLKFCSRFIFWYSTGLMLFTLGVLFLSQSSIDSRLYWLGKVTIYIGSIYFLITVIVARNEVRINNR